MVYQIYKEQKGADFRYIDKIVEQQFLHAGTKANIYAYVGPKQNTPSSDTTPNYISLSSAVSEGSIQDVLLLENRERTYNLDVIELPCHYDIGDIDFDLQQFGLFIGNDTIVIKFPYTMMLTMLGRKLMSGDVLELPHMRDVDLLDPNAKPINKFYVIQDASKDSQSFSPTWHYHVWKVKCIPISDSPEFKDIIGDGSKEGDLKNTMSTYNKEMDIMNALVAAADNNVPKIGFETQHLYEDPLHPNTLNQNQQPSQYDGNGIPINMNNQPASGTRNPSNPSEGDFFLRTDYTPPKLFKYENSRWRLQETVLRRDWTPANRLAETYINNKAEYTCDGEVQQSKIGEPDIITPKQEF